MAKNLFTKAVALLLCFALSGCATDQQRTKTQGTVIGAVGGAVLLGGLGALAGVLSGNRDNVARYAIAGAAAGAALGGVAGYNWGANVAREKAAYANTEDYLDACIGDTRAATAAAQRQNQSLRNQIAQLNAQSQQALVAYQQGQVDRQYLAGASAAVQERRADVQQKAQNLTQQIAIERNALAQARTKGSSAKLQQFNNEIRALSAQKAELQAHNQELASISNRLGV